METKHDREVHSQQAGTRGRGRGAHAQGATRALTKALTVKQPWAALIMAGIKDVENRAWATNHRGELLIHAGKAYDASADLSALPDTPGDDLMAAAGVIVGTVQLLDCVQGHPSEWAEPDCWHWVLAEPRLYDVPVPHRGSLGLWVPKMPILR
ncbi:ASCH domain-containing protein [Rhodococcus hoagii]|nr:ASCH domain-containing protein [Prescottella equi]